MQRFAPYLLDRLIDAAPGIQGEAVKPMLSLEQLKASVARDVEALLNTRRGIAADALQPFPLARRSVLAFGLDDFASRSLASTEDQAAICRALERAIAHHEPRLQSLRVDLGRRDSTSQGLKFSIRAVLYVHPMQAPVNFDAVLQPSTQQYTVAAARHLPPEAAP
jgi:type VI secretion system protein ImpF